MLTRYKATFEVQVNVEGKLIKQGSGNSSAFLPYLSKAVHMNCTSDPKMFVKHRIFFGPQPGLAPKLQLCSDVTLKYLFFFTETKTSLCACGLLADCAALRKEYWKLSAMTKFYVLHLQGLVVSKSQGDTDGSSDTE